MTSKTSFPTCLVAETLVKEGLPVRLKTSGSSMYPFIASGDLVTISPVRQQPNPGDIVAYQCNNAIVCHRIVGYHQVNGSLYARTRGDAHDFDDSEIRFDKIIGVVTAVERKNRSVRRKLALFLKRIVG